MLIIYVGTDRAVCIRNLIWLLVIFILMLAHESRHPRLVLSSQKVARKVSLQVSSFTLSSRNYVIVSLKVKVSSAGSPAEARLVSRLSQILRSLEPMIAGNFLIQANSVGTPMSPTFDLKVPIVQRRSSIFPCENR